MCLVFVLKLKINDMCVCFAEIIMSSLRANGKDKCTKQTNQTTNYKCTKLSPGKNTLTNPRMRSSF